MTVPTPDFISCSTSITRIVSGGQTGVDRGALDAAMELQIEHGGWCPRGRRSEDGSIPEKYRLQETVSSRYSVRTERNVLDSDATLVLCSGPPVGGTALTVRLAAKHAKPVYIVRLDQSCDEFELQRWLSQHRCRILNIAGPRESTFAGAQLRTKEFLLQLLRSRQTASHVDQAEHPENVEPEDEEHQAENE